MDTDRKWVIVRIDGKIATISTDYKALAAISARLVQQKSPVYRKITAETVSFADLCQNKAGVRAVAHAIGLNPVAVVIPCHLVIPKESIDYIKGIQEKAQSTIFKGDDISMEKLLQEKGIDFGEYALGRKLKRALIQKELSQ